jgi:hypothetical protein
MVRGSAGAVTASGAAAAVVAARVVDLPVAPSLGVVVAMLDLLLPVGKNHPR